MSTESAREIEEAAGGWLARRDAGALTCEDETAFEAWINESTLHRVAYLRLEHAWEEAMRLKALGAGVQSDQPPPPGQWNLSPFFVKRRSEKSGAKALQRLAVGLSLAVGAIATWYWWPVAGSYETQLGAVAAVPMADGSKVTLNTDSKIRVAMTERERRVELKHGEAFFEVAKDSSRPFVVAAGIKRVVAVGTMFSVRRDGDEVRVVVTEGSVRIESAMLIAGTVARTRGAEVVVQRKPVQEAEEQLSWRSGVLIFRNSTLREAAAEFNRYNERKIVIEDGRVGALRVAGSFRTNNIDAFVRLLEQGYPVKREVQDERIVLSKR